MRKKVSKFPDLKFSGEPRAKEEFSSKRADGTTNTHPQERMKASNQTNNRQG
ncbi:small, acid-soluble spore protein K [Guptibacillus algicola]|uniref:small, acid-soluble spore protein K n=1 Tax=Guptibacillus algicola TaxID=225844 RepID=UPI001CD39528|nr:small, acid-soluble spore protein K [Alkalihalobacillus algicola]MCA0989371.1 small, acid-soluble spore protein K [Alkalihalobacillus algicola]